jgi:DNA adenine methylase
MPNLQLLERLQRLERLEKLRKVSKNMWKILQITSKSYEEVEIPYNAVVYCDPPYKGTATYAEWWFDHDKFWDYVRKISKTNKVFVSEYSAPQDFKCIYEFSQKSSLAWWTQQHNNQPNEKVFIYNQ